MMSSYAGLDLVALIEQVSGIRLTKKARHWQDGPEYWGICPFPGCGGKDRFHAWPEAARPHYWCRVCGRQGSPPWFLVEYLGMKYPQALGELGLASVPDVQQKGAAKFQSDDRPGEMWL